MQNDTSGQGVFCVCRTPRPGVLGNVCLDCNKFLPGRAPPPQEPRCTVCDWPLSAAGCVAATDDKPADCAKVRPHKPLTNAELCQAMSDLGMRHRSAGQTIVAIVLSAHDDSGPSGEELVLAHGAVAHADAHVLSNCEPIEVLPAMLRAIADLGEKTS